MKNQTKYIFVALVLITLISSCSTRKNKFINRNYHALTTKYNVLFNGNEALKQGVLAIKEKHKEDFWAILPLELKVSPQANALPGTAKNPNFEKAEEKAVKAVQMHSMNLQGKEQNTQISEAYLLLGKARYYDQRYVPAMEAFNYTIRYYSDKEKVAQAKLWREKTNIALENEDVAVENLNILLGEKALDKEIHKDLAVTLAQAYINTKVYDKAINAIDTALVYNKDKAFKARLYYIKGQLWQKLQQKDSAKTAFQEVIDLKRKGDWALYVNAIIQNQLIQNDSTQALAVYNKLEKNRENKPFLGRIYYEKAMLALAADNGAAAEELFTKAIDKAKGDKKLQAKAYEQLADYYFNTAKYTDAGSFYAKVLPLLNKRTKKYRLIKKRFENLGDVIKYEASAKKNDSILMLTTFSKEKLKTYFEDYIKKLKEKDALEAAAKVQNSNEAAASLAQSNANAAQNGFYFYTQTAVSYGRAAFNKKWGDRILEDYWRYADKSLQKAVDSEVEEEVAAVAESDKYDVDKYIATVPTTTEKIKTIKDKRDFAYYQLGLIYKEQFKEYPLAIEKLEKTLAFKPQERLILPAKYNLYKLYELTDNTSKAASYKDDITSNYPKSQYAKIITNPEALLNDTANNPDTLFVATTKLFLAKKYTEALQQADQNAKAFFGTSQALRFELLKAKILGRVEGLKSFKKATEFIALNHPKTKEGKEAQALLEGLIKNLETKEFTKDANDKHWKIVYEIVANGDANQPINTINTAKQSLGRNSLKTSTDFYTKNAKLVVLHGFKSEKEAKEFAKYMDNNGYVISNKKYIISSNDYALAQIKKNISTYK